MKKYTCAIVDDEPQAVELLADILGSLYPNILVEKTYTRWSEALEGLRSSTCDLLFLDISMQGRSGLELLRYLPGLKSEVIFITAYSEHALEAFRLSAAGYIVKPVDEAELVKVVDKVLERIVHRHAASAGSRIKSKIGIPGSHAIDYIDTDDIIYLEAFNSYTNVVTAGKTIVSAYNLQKFRQTLDEAIFFQVHRSYIINLNHVRRYENLGMVVMEGGREIPVSKSTREQFLAIFDRVKHHTR